MKDIIVVRYSESRHPDELPSPSGIDPDVFEGVAGEPESMQRIKTSSPKNEEQP